MGDGAFQDTSLSDGRLRQDSGQPDPVTRNAGNCETPGCSSARRPVSVSRLRLSHPRARRCRCRTHRPPRCRTHRLPRCRTHRPPRCRTHRPPRRRTRRRPRRRMHRRGRAHRTHRSTPASEASTDLAVGRIACGRHRTHRSTPASDASPTAPSEASLTPASEASAVVRNRSLSLGALVGFRPTPTSGKLDSLDEQPVRPLPPTDSTAIATSACAPAYFCFKHILDYPSENKRGES